MSIFNSKKISGGYTPDLVKRGGERQKRERMRKGCVMAVGGWTSLDHTCNTVSHSVRYDTIPDAILTCAQKLT